MDQRPASGATVVARPSRMRSAGVCQWGGVPGWRRRVRCGVTDPDLEILQQAVAELPWGDGVSPVALNADTPERPTSLVTASGQRLKAVTPC